MTEKDALEKLRSNPGVTGAFVLDRDTRLRLALEEAEILLPCGLIYENRGVDDLRDCDVAFCVFSPDVIYEPTTFTIAMTGDDGTVFGHNVPRSMPRSEVQNDAVWISDDFIIYPDLHPTEQPKMVLYPYEFKDLGPGEGIRKANAFNPAVSTDLMLKEKFGIKEKRMSSTVITAYYV